MLTNNQILQETGDILENTHKIAIESEGLGFDALNELKGQRRKINIIGEKVQDVGTNITKANRIIKTMDNRRICMKIVMMATILLLIIALAICLYIKIG
jgi:Snare region anchored in the vesicle membrane C-terminus.